MPCACEEDDGKGGLPEVVSGVVACTAQTGQIAGSLAVGADDPAETAAALPVEFPQPGKKSTARKKRRISAGAPETTAPASPMSSTRKQQRRKDREQSPSPGQPMVPSAAAPPTSPPRSMHKRHRIELKSGSPTHNPTASRAAAAAAAPAEEAAEDPCRSASLLRSKQKKGGRKQREPSEGLQGEAPLPFPAAATDDAQPAAAAPGPATRQKGGRKPREAPPPGVAAASQRTDCVQRDAANIPWGGSSGSPDSLAEDARSLFADRLLMPTSSAAQAMHVRPQLQVCYPCAEGCGVQGAGTGGIAVCSSLNGTQFEVCSVLHGKFCLSMISRVKR